jgi:hypothetical protein
MGFFDNDPGGMFGASLLNPSGGMLDPQQYMAARSNAGMLGLAQGLLASSGASRLPVTLGAAFGAGLQGMQQGQKAFNEDALNQAKLPYLRAQTQESQLRQGLTQAQIDQLRQQLSLGKLAINQATSSANQPAPTIDQVLGGGGQPAGAATGDVSAQASSASWRSTRRQARPITRRRPSTKFSAGVGNRCSLAPTQVNLRLATMRWPESRTKVA